MRIEDHFSELAARGRVIVNEASGRIFSLASNTPRRPLGATTKKGYVRICVSMDGQQYHGLAHRIVWVMANGPIPDGAQIDHLNGNKADNRLANLDLVTGAENMRRAAMNGLTNGGWRDGPRDPKSGQFLGKKAAGRLLDRRTHDEVPT